MEVPTTARAEEGAVVVDQMGWPTGEGQRRWPATMGGGNRSLAGLGFLPSFVFFLFFIFAGVREEKGKREIKGKLNQKLE